ncbi:MAG: hypothetical protein JWM12_3597, partial [Ilumatobacteraceae bacterium]|nr:hypothetical protein [Ilumatobacteraceae bacterium]
LSRLERIPDKDEVHSSILCSPTAKHLADATVPLRAAPCETLQVHTRCTSGNLSERSSAQRPFVAGARNQCSGGQHAAAPRGSGPVPAIERLNIDLSSSLIGLATTLRVHINADSGLTTGPV